MLSAVRDLAQRLVDDLPPRLRQHHLLRRPQVRIASRAVPLTASSAIPALPLFANDRRFKNSITVCGTSRPLAAFSMVEVLLFQRTFLRTLDQACVTAAAVEFLMHAATRHAHQP